LLHSRRSFEKNYLDIEDLKERVSTFAVTCAEKLRCQQSCCKTFLSFINISYFFGGLQKTNLKFVTENMVKQIEEKINNRPVRKFNYLTPNQVLQEKIALIT